MNSSSDRVSAIVAALRAKREAPDISAPEALAALESSLLAEIDAFDPERARQAATAVAPPAASLASAAAPVARQARPAGVTTVTPAVAAEAPAAGGLLDQLRQQAAACQREQHASASHQASQAGALEQALGQVFSYLHELVQQLNILKPPIQRDYVLLNQLALHGLRWQEGFADYRRQAESAGALIELVSFTCRLGGAPKLTCERDDTGAERFRALLFDLGLNFDSQEFRNDKRLVERVRFEIRGELGVSVRWRADFARGLIVLEARNLERFGSTPYELLPGAVDQALLDEFGRLLLGQPNRFRELARRR